MPRAWLLPVSVAIACAALIGSARRPATPERAIVDTAVERAAALLALDAYVDPFLGFTLAIPGGWMPVVVAAGADVAGARVADAGATPALELEPGYAVGFEPPRERGAAPFPDHLMVEILPGRESGLFETDGRHRRPVTIDGRVGWRDELALGTDPGDPAAVDLLVRQAAFTGLGYTVGLYAIGTPARRALLDDAFEAMLRTFRLGGVPFDVG